MKQISNSPAWSTEDGNYIFDSVSGQITITDDHDNRRVATLSNATSQSFRIILESLTGNTALTDEQRREATVDAMLAFFFTWED